ncbi:CBM96 family carbohydrate-binding protein [Pyxidicoccus xibeiensis]|uniref:CBM96 family carbohydrate-binding protein n=1 Tax=Pyxidicoccus xibeiensis TaxID=2906759 RepID=UPI0020A76906|nr:DNRLRE domain-containing protein [Pyxidicoccus xibeiensis]MCP3139232.1 DNRLRE domain-containing protein [Pyxidicoccus xibeiensis]
MKGWRKGLGLLPALGMMVGCGGVAGPEETAEAPALKSAEAAAVTEACEPRTVHTDESYGVTYDTYVEQDAAGTAHGTSTKLVSDGSPRQDTYLDFRFSLLDESFIRARIRLYATDGSTNGPALYRTSSGWTDTLTWSTRPAPIGGAVANVGEVASGSWVEYDVTSVVTGSGAHAFVLIPEGGNGVDFVSREDSRQDLRPQLVLTYAHTVCTYQGTGGEVTDVQLEGGAGDETMQALATDSTGAYVVAGYYNGSGNLGGATFPGPKGLLLGRFRADGTHEWSSGFPQDSAEMNVTGVTLTPLGNVLVVGYYMGTPQLGTFTLPTAPLYGTFLAKFSPSGRLTWARGFTASYGHGEDIDHLSVIPRAVATDANGSLIVTGFFFGNTNLGGGLLYAGPSSTPYNDAYPGLFIAKYSWEGNHLWSKAYDAGSYGTWGESLATDSAGNVLLGGYASSTSGGAPVLGATSRETPVIAKFSPDGTLLWNRALNGARGTVVGVAALPGDAVAFAGRFNRTFTFAGQTLASSQANEPDGGNTDVMLGVLEAVGTDRWARRHGDDNTESVTRMVVDAQGNFRLAGTHVDPVNLGGGTIGAPRGTSAHVFVASYGPDGVHQWSRSVGPSFSWQPLLGVTPDGSTLFGGTISGPTFVHTTQYGPPQGADLFLLKLTP